MGVKKAGGNSSGGHSNFQETGHKAHDDLTFLKSRYKEVHEVHRADYLRQRGVIVASNLELTVKEKDEHTR